MNSDKNFQTDKLNDVYLGIVVNNEDPLFLGRCKVKVVGKFDNIPDEHLPWCYPLRSFSFAKTGTYEGKKGTSGAMDYTKIKTGGFGSFSFPKLYSYVSVRFAAGDINSGQYQEIETMNIEMKEEISGESYKNAQVLTYDIDEDLRIFYTVPKGLLIWHKESFITIDQNKNIKVHHAGNSSWGDMVEGTWKNHADTKWTIESPEVHLGSHNAPDHPLLCSGFKQLMQNFSTMIKSIPPNGPAIGAALDSAIAAMGPSLCSQTVFIEK